MKHQNITVVGAGAIGQAILRGLLATGHPPAKLRATTRAKVTADRLAEELGITVTTDNRWAVSGADTLVFALKPTTLPTVTQSLAKAGVIKPGTLAISIAAGLHTSDIEATLGHEIPVIRVMPNIPCAIRCGMAVLSRGSIANDSHIGRAQKIFEPLGRVLELEEKHMDTVTGLSASGPAFVYIMIEALADGGVARGLPRRAATELAAQMVFGAAAMVIQSGRHPAALKDEVTTPAGCTIAGILVLEDGRIRSVLSRAVEVASVRAGELGKPGMGPVIKR